MVVEEILLDMLLEKYEEFAGTLRLEREERATARLQHWHQRDQEQRLEQTEVRQARLD